MLSDCFADVAYEKGHKKVDYAQSEQPCQAKIGRAYLADRLLVQASHANSNVAHGVRLD